MSLDIESAKHIFEHFIRDNTNIGAAHVVVNAPSRIVVDSADAGYQPFTLVDSSLGTIRTRGSGITKIEGNEIAFEIDPSISLLLVLWDIGFATYSEPRTTYERIMLDSSQLGQFVNRGVSDQKTQMYFAASLVPQSENKRVVKFYHYNDQQYNYFQALILALEFPLLK